MNLLFTAGQAATAVIAILTLVGILVKYALLKPIKLYIDQATKQIAPNANGGRSLNDLVDKVDDLKTMLVAHISHHGTRK
jgi:xanthosine utilization system XapX-like protein